MNSDSEAFANQLFYWLLQDTASNSTPPLGEEESINGIENHSEGAVAKISDGMLSEGIPNTIDLGEIPAVQDRFQAVLKRRLQVEIAKHPPLFPWETELLDYPDFVETPSFDFVPQVWAAQQKNLPLSVRLPENIFRQLLDRCQTMVKTTLPPGPKLIQVVENLFPSRESQTLNQLAGLVLMTHPRSPVDNLSELASYSDLMPPQQMALSLMAAKELLDTLTLSVSPSNPIVERQWLTNAGTLQLQVAYQLEGEIPKLRVQGKLPTSGVLQLRSHQAEAMAQCASPGELSVEISGVEVNQTYTLEVQFPNLDLQPLTFAICPTL